MNDYEKDREAYFEPEPTDKMIDKEVYAADNDWHKIDELAKILWVVKSNSRFVNWKNISEDEREEWRMAADIAIMWVEKRMS